MFMEAARGIGCPRLGAIVFMEAARGLTGGLRQDAD